MKCPFCGHKEDKVIDSRSTQDDSSIRRRRECLQCGKRFTTYEYIEKIPLMVIKKDSRREPFDRNKILQGLIKASQKRPISMAQLESLVEEVEKEIQKKYDREIESKAIGELVIQRLARLDDVAYVRFASVYRQFKDVNEFMRELKDILSKRRLS
ncbi:MAG TPA: transcriptional repressor NrdR [Candidatus Omnitrophica bacterium]|nr:MAG: transcriptional regulator NrdR [Candidatus Omnitrophota bacterium]RKY35283.1 MAG: transcriptional regulator NrdR [Candidatus Omnitrophota bacterium]RKY45087.1 MAG: transcriptional regulator NrdR [Candidatus Omnitrophota bacterium]HEC69061.1 transcriptional repressor NrdR [Candidatus Omnitrophota bacterium]